MSSENEYRRFAANSLELANRATNLVEQDPPPDHGGGLA